MLEPLSNYIIKDITSISNSISKYSCDRLCLSLYLPVLSTCIGCSNLDLKICVLGKTETIEKITILLVLVLNIGYAQIRWPAVYNDKSKTNEIYIKMRINYVIIE